MTIEQKELSWRKNDNGNKELNSFKAQPNTNTLHASKKKEEVTLIKGIGPMRKKYLSEARINTIKDVANAPTKRLSAINSIGSTIAKQIKKTAKKHLKEVNLGSFLNLEVK